MATIRKRGEKWQVQVRRKGQQPLSRSFQKKADAQTWARNTEADLDRQGLPPNTRQLKSTTVHDLIERYRDTMTVRKRGKVQETDRLNLMLRHRLAKATLAELSPSIFTKYRDERLTCCKPETVRRELSLLQHVFEIARREWGVPITVNPLANVKKPPADPPRERRLDGDELDRLIEACAKCRNKLIKPLILLAIETAMRRGELLNIRWQDIDFGRRTLHIPQTKNGHPRTIPLSPKALEILQQLHGSNEPRVFPFSPNAVRLSWQRLTKRAGINNLHFHDLRHEAISRFFELGLSVPEVALISGHRDFRMLFRYTHLRAEDVATKLHASP